MTVDVNGFGRFEQKDIVVTAGERQSPGTIALTPGATRQTVTVQATAMPVQTGSAEYSADLDKHEIEALLARGLNYGGLIRSLPGISGGADPNGFAGNTAIYSSINGIRASNTIPGIDGVNAADPPARASFTGRPPRIRWSKSTSRPPPARRSMEAVPEASSNLVMRSGTQQFHGDLYGNLRKEDLNTNDFFNNHNRVSKPIYRYAIGGSSIGGPVYIPENVKKNKVFFFFNDQYWYQGIPTALERAATSHKTPKNTPGAWTSLAFTDKIRLYGRINQINNTQSGPRPSGLHKGFVRRC